MTNGTNKSYQNLIPPHGGYRKLKSYQTAEIIFDLTVEFCESYLTNKTNKTHKSYRTYDQMVQAARSGKQNIAEGCQASGTSKKTELKLIGVARESLEELLIDFEDFLRVNGLRKWEKDSPEAQEVRARAYWSNRTHKTYLSFFSDAEKAANAVVCLIHQANFLLDRQLKTLSEEFFKNGGFTERLYQKRNEELKRKVLFKGRGWE
jgi:four helix bundle suffix protein